MLSQAHNRLREGKGWVDAAWVVSCCDVFFLLWLLFSFLSIQFCSSQQPGTWQNLAAIPTQPFPVQTAPVNFYNPVLKLQARLLLPAPRYLFALPVWPQIFHVYVTLQLLQLPSGP